MAYVSQEMKAVRAPKIRELLRKYDVKGSLSVRNHMTLCLTITSGALDFIGDATEGNRRLAEMRGTTPHRIQDYLDVNPYYIDDIFSGKVAEFLHAAVNALHGEDYYDNTDIRSDYFDCSHYISIQIGKWNKPYEFVKK